MTVRTHVVTATTDASGDATAYSPYISGKLHSIQYVKPGSGYFDDGVDFTITSENTGLTLWTESNVNATKHCFPRAASHSTAGVAALYASGGTAVTAPIALGRDRVKLVVAQGGNTKTGAFHITVED
ncbi:hypothetical protein ACFQ1E_17380 [Sphingomonas canadensis]|uniref:Uncharacterized protein n=1 Tax=Sphingomonas canadensis TaxID=1219257 RepID=A0ABW3HAQ3_9SPHN|nr:hypothetical protein [Sphingomonas canadensis]MCW3837820.1 hypothetical protein [Sphingomonas canadensis]